MHGLRPRGPDPVHRVSGLARSARRGFLGDSVDAVGKFFSNLASIRPARCCWGWRASAIYLALRSRAWFNVLRAAYPDEPIECRRIWGAYMAAYGFNNVVPARGGDVIKLFLTRKTSIPHSSYPAVASRCSSSSSSTP